MLFNSYEFIFIFLPLTFFIYFYLNQRRLTQWGKVWLVLSSLFFYSWWNIVYLPLIIASIFVNYFIGNLLSQYEKYKKPLLSMGIMINVALLGYFKYSDFFIENINMISGAIAGRIFHDNSIKIPNDFGILVTKDNIINHLNYLKKQIKSYELSKLKSYEGFK